MKLTIHIDSAIDTIFHLLQHLSPNHQKRFAALCWSLWKHRNLKVWEDIDESCATIVDRARTLIEDWEDANSVHQSMLLHANRQQVQADTHLQQALHQHHSHSGTVTQQWLPPSLGRYKCNVDVAFSDQFQRTGIGVCLWDDTRTFVLAKALQFDHYFPVAVGEALGLFHALQWMQDMHFDYIDFELDSKVTRDAFHSRHTDITEFGSIITACREMFSTSFPNSRVEFIRWQAYSAAHALTREAISLASPTTYYVIPICIEHIIINEML